MMCRCKFAAQSLALNAFVPDSTEHQSILPFARGARAAGAIAIALLYVFYKEVRKIPAKLFTLMITAFIDMVGLLMIIPLLPFYVKELSGDGLSFGTATSAWEPLPDLSSRSYTSRNS